MDAWFFGLLRMDLFQFCPYFKGTVLIPGIQSLLLKHVYSGVPMKTTKCLPNSITSQDLHSSLWSLFFRIVSSYADCTGSTSRSPAPEVIAFENSTEGLVYVFATRRK